MYVRYSARIDKDGDLVASTSLPSVIWLRVETDLLVRPELAIGECLFGRERRLSRVLGWAGIRMMMIPVEVKDKLVKVAST